MFAFTGPGVSTYVNNACVVIYPIRVWRNTIKTLEDIYRCPKCFEVAAYGNSFCRSCGNQFSVDEVREMRANISSVFGVLPWNTRDRYRCVHCLEFICITDQYCRGCGDYICDKEKQMMRAKLSDLAKNNLPSVILCFGFVLAVIGVLLAANA